jgi:choline dehydrogenase
MMDLYMNHGRRSDAYKEFLVPIMSRRSNLVIRKYSFVTKILFIPETTEATGVADERHGRLFKAFAKKEVIISAGTLKSAKLLMLSGKRPKEHLQKVGVSFTEIQF